KKHSRLGKSQIISFEPCAALNKAIFVVHYSSDQLIDLLKENKLDFTFSCDEEVIGSFESFPSFSDTILLAVPETFFLPQRLLDLALTASDVTSGRHRAKDIPAVNFKEFPAFNFILIDAHVNLGARTLKIFEEAGASPRVRIKVPQLVTAFSLAASGVGAAFISDRLVTGREKGLRFFKLQSPYAQRHYFLLLPHRSYTPSAVKEFIRLMEP
ncbi:LysR family transcriptional regulator substrate-binding protein, partial [Dialister sp.]